MIRIITNFEVSKKSPLDTRESVADQAARLAITWLYKNLKVFQQDTQQEYVYIGDETSNTVNDWELIRNLYKLSAAPSGTLGAIGDLCIDDTATIFYEKTGASTWTALFDFGGAQIFVDTGAPDNGNGVNGDVYIRDTGDVYRKAAGVWNLQFNIKGADGADGDLYATTSSTSVDLGAVVYPLAITVEQDLSYTAGQEVIIASRANPNTDYIDGIVESYVAGTGVLTLQSGTENGTGAHTDWDVNVKGASRGKQGKAFRHTEADINLTQAKVDAVEGGSWTDTDPWTASILNDTRSASEQTATPGIVGNMSGKSILYNGTTWINNGTWRGPQGIQGIPGPQGIPGIQGIPGPAGGLTPQIQSYPYTIVNKLTGWYLCEVVPGVTNVVTLGGGNQVGTIVTAVLSKPTIPLNDPVPLESEFAGITISTSSSSNRIIHKGRYVTSIPLSSRSITLICISLSSGNNTWMVVGETTVFDKLQQILDPPLARITIANISIRAAITETVLVFANPYRRQYPPVEYIYKKGWKPLINVMLVVESGQAAGNNYSITVERAIGSPVAFTQVYRLQSFVRGTNVPDTINISCYDHELPDGTQGQSIYYRVVVAPIENTATLIATTLDNIVMQIVPIVGINGQSFSP